MSILFDRYFDEDGHCGGLPISEEEIKRTKVSHQVWVALDEMIKDSKKK